MDIIKYFILICCIIICIMSFCTDGWMGFWSAFIWVFPLFISVSIFGWFGILMYPVVGFFFVLVFFMVVAMVGLPGALEPCTHHDPDVDAANIEACEICVAKNTELIETFEVVVKKVFTSFKRHWLKGLMIFGALLIVQDRLNRRRRSTGY